MKKIKTVLMKFRILYKIELIFLAFRDYGRYKKSAYKLHKKKNYENLRAMITFHYHAIEKGLTNENLRLGFGKTAFKNLFSAMDLFVKNGYDVKDVRFQTALSVIDFYIKLHDENNFDITSTKTNFSKFEKYLSTDEFIGGKLLLEKNENKKKLDFYELALNRHSVRDYAKDKVDHDKVKNALSIASKTPSVCNRQPWHVYLTYDIELINKLLDLQHGIRNMANNVSGLIVVCSNNNYLAAGRERNQGFSDAGMYSMSLLYALEYENIAACPLNANFSLQTDKKIRKIMNIPKNQNVVMFITIGEFKSSYEVPVSQRDPLENYLTIL